GGQGALPRGAPALGDSADVPRGFAPRDVSTSSSDARDGAPIAAFTFSERSLRRAFAGEGPDRPPIVLPRGGEMEDAKRRPGASNFASTCETPPRDVVSENPPIERLCSGARRSMLSLWV